MSSSLLCISSLSRAFDRVTFKSGIEELDRFLKKYALKNQQIGISRTRVLHESNSIIILGYHTICAASITCSKLPVEVSRKLPQYPVPCVLLARLAVDRNARGNGYGKMLLKDAIDRAVEVSQLAGAFALLVDAKDENAVSFYKHFGFLQMIDQQSTLFLPIKTFA